MTQQADEAEQVMNAAAAEVDDMLYPIDAFKVGWREGVRWDPRVLALVETLKDVLRDYQDSDTQCGPGEWTNGPMRELVLRALAAWEASSGS